MRRKSDLVVLSLFPQKTPKWSESHLSLPVTVDGSATDSFLFGGAFFSFARDQLGERGANSSNPSFFLFPLRLRNKDQVISALFFPVLCGVRSVS